MTRRAVADRPRPIVLVVLDGFGIGHDPAADAIAAAPMPTWRGLLRTGRTPRCAPPRTRSACRPGQMGNSEVGHLNLGAGRPVLQDLPRIDAAIADGSFFERPALLEACARARDGPGILHVVSLIGPGGVHANDRHLVALAELAARRAAFRRSASTPCSTAATRRPRPALGFVVDLETPPGRRPTRDARIASRSAAATTRWTATSAGNGSSAATTRSSTARRRTTRRRRHGRHRGRLRPRRDR